MCESVCESECVCVCVCVCVRMCAIYSVDINVPLIFQHTSINFVAICRKDAYPFIITNSIQFVCGFWVQVCVNHGPPATCFKG